MDKLHSNTRLLFTALGMVKWTPAISAYPSVGSTALLIIIFKIIASLLPSRPPFDTPAQH